MVYVTRKDVYCVIFLFISTVKGAAQTTISCGGGVVGQPTVLSCSISGSITQDIYWYRYNTTDAENIVQCVKLSPESVSACVANRALRSRYNVSTELQPPRNPSFTIISVTAEDLEVAWLCVDKITFPDRTSINEDSTCSLKPGQTYSLSGSTSYGIRGGGYIFTCQIYGGNLVPSDIIQFNRDSMSVCRHVLTCLSSVPSGRYTCGCINGNNRQLYLNITNIQVTDAGDWTCGDSFNIATSQAVTLPVYYGPENIRFEPTSSSITVIENESRTVTCSADCNPPCNIKWYKGADTTTASGSNGLLSLTKRQHAGNYTCQITNTQIPGSLQSKQLMVIVHYGPENIRFTPTSSSITVIENKSRTVTCSADCNPPCNINWKKGSAPSGSNGLLSLSNITRQQAGNYTCHVTNTQISGSLQSKQLMVIVYYPPTITSLAPDGVGNMINEESTVTFNCSVDSLPSSVISWSRSQQGEQLYSGSQYTIPKAICQHTDNYTCTASNNIGQPVSKTIPLYVRCAPVLDHNQETKTTISLGRGETGVLSIHVLAYPLPVYTWYYQLQDGSKQPIIEFRTRQKDDGLSSILTIQDVTEDDSGTYIVYVNNSLGTRSTVFNLVVSSEDTSVDGYSSMLGVGIAIGLGISVLVVGIATALAWVILKRNGKRFGIKSVKASDQRVVKDSDTLENITLSDTPHVYDQVNTAVTNTRDTVNTSVLEISSTDYINTSTTSSPYEILDKQTMDQQPNTYQQLSPYQNLAGDKN
ncbi:hemicentin-1 [Patella vulgata]|uniref:hemicentin-1 n=1 Tax=Patella vulgata TaxID=6465 RepID=UPI0024A97B37|nr:hemicentin-1 [Patella vulgata]